MTVPGRLRSAAMTMREWLRRGLRCLLAAAAALASKRVQMLSLGRAGAKGEVERLRGADRTLKPATGA